MTVLRFLAAAALVLAAAGKAGAAVPTGFPVGTATRLALAGDRVLLWSHEGPALSVREPDGTVRELYRAVERRGTIPVIAEVAATSSQIAFVTEGFRRSGDGGVAWTSLRAGSLGGPYRLIAGRERAGGRVEPRDVALSDAGLLLSDDRGLVLRPSGGGAPQRLGGTGGERIAVNGRYAATRTFGHAAVYDLQARRRVARVAVAADPRSEPSAGVALDGTLVFVDARRRLWAFAPSTGRRTLLMRGADAIVHVGGSTVYAVTRSRGSYSEALQRLWAVDLGGGEPRPLTEAVFGGEFVSDGVRVLYRRERCAFLGDQTAPERAPVTAGCPRQPFRFAAAERQRRREVRMRVICPGASADRCTGTARLTAGRAVLGTWRFDAAGGTTVTHALRVRSRRRSRVTARLCVTGSPYGRSARRIVLDPVRR